MGHKKIINLVPLDILDDFFCSHKQGTEIFIKITPGSRKERLFINSNMDLCLGVGAKAHDNQANNRVLEVLSQLFLYPKAKIKILHGQKSRYKHILFIGIQKKNLIA